MLCRLVSGAGASSAAASSVGTPAGVGEARNGWPGSEIQPSACISTMTSNEMSSTMVISMNMECRWFMSSLRECRVACG